MIPTAVGSADITALVAERIVREILTGIALRRVACSVMQCAPPPRRARLVAGTPTTSRSGKTDRTCASPSAIGGQAGERDDHAAVADVEVQVRQRQPPSRPLAVGEDVELDHLEAGRLERRAVRLQPGVVRIVAVPDRLAEDAPGRDERRHVVDVAAGAILEQAVLEPDRALDAEELSERGLALRARHAGIPPLVEDRGLRRDQRALAVRADGASFEHERDGDALEPEPLGQAGPIVSPCAAAGSVSPQPLKRKSTATSSSRSRRAKIGPESRSQASPSGSSTTSTAGPQYAAASGPKPGLATIEHRLEVRDRPRDERVVRLRGRDQPSSTRGRRRARPMMQRSCGSHSAGVTTFDHAGVVRPSRALLPPT